MLGLNILTFGIEKVLSPPEAREVVSCSKVVLELGQLPLLLALPAPQALYVPAQTRRSAWAVLG